MGKRGPKSIMPTAEQRQMVEAMAGFGIPQEDIAKVMINQRTRNCYDPVTLRKHFRHELDVGHVKANAKVAKTAFEMAVSGTVPSATFFWLKCRANWKETVRTEHTGKDGAALPSIDIASLTNAQIDSIFTRLSIALGIAETVRGPAAGAREAPQSRDGAVH